MAMWNAKMFRSKIDLMNHLNGVLVGSNNLFSGALVDGLTFIVDIGGGDVVTTFAPAKNRPWTLAEIVAAIDAGISGVPYAWNNDIGPVSGTPPDRRLALTRDGAITVKSTGTANALLGFSTTANTVSAPIPDTSVFSINRVTLEQDTWVLVTYV